MTWYTELSSTEKNDWYDCGDPSGCFANDKHAAGGPAVWYGNSITAKECRAKCKESPGCLAMSMDVATGGCFLHFDSNKNCVQACDEMPNTKQCGTYQCNYGWSNYKGLYNFRSVSGYKCEKPAKYGPNNRCNLLKAKPGNSLHMGTLTQEEFHAARHTKSSAPVTGWSKEPDSLALYNTLEASKSSYPGVASGSAGSDWNHSWIIWAAVGAAVLVAAVVVIAKRQPTRAKGVTKP